MEPSTAPRVNYSYEEITDVPPTPIINPSLSVVEIKLQNYKKELNARKTREIMREKISKRTFKLLPAV